MGQNENSLNCPRRKLGFFFFWRKFFDWIGRVGKDFIVLPELVTGSWVQI